MSESQVVDVKAVKITFTNADVRSFAYEPLEIDPAGIAHVFHRFAEAGHILLNTEDRIIFIPMSSVQSPEITPKPDGKLPNSINVLHEFDQ